MNIKFLLKIKSIHFYVKVKWPGPFRFHFWIFPLWNFPVAHMIKNLPVMQETWVWSLGQEKSSGEGNGNPFQYSCLEDPMDKGAWQGSAHGVAKNQTWLSGWHYFQVSKYRERQWHGQMKEWEHFSGKDECFLFDKEKEPWFYN